MAHPQALDRGVTKGGGFPPAETVLLDGCRVSLHRAGPRQGLPVLLLHGGGMDCAALSWRVLMPHLAETRHVIAPDWPGYGASAPIDGPSRIPDLGRWLVRLLDALGLARVDCVGISMGAGAGLWLALEHPARLRRLVAAGPYGLQRRAPVHLLSYLATRLPAARASFWLLRRDPRLMRRALAQIFKHPQRITEGLVAEVMAALTTGDPGRAFARFQHDEIGWSRLHSVISDRVASIPHKVLFVQGDGDRLVPREAVAAAARAMPAARLDLMDAGHWPMRERPEAFNARVADFLAEGHRDGPCDG